MGTTADKKKIYLVSQNTIIKKNNEGGLGI